MVSMVELDHRSSVEKTLVKVGIGMRNLQVITLQLV